MDTLKDILERYAPLISKELIASLPKNNPAFYPILYHYGLMTENGGEILPEKVKLPGKMLRPVLAMLTYEGLQKNKKGASKTSISPILPGAIAIEHLHNFSLIHDDLEDKDRIRHGKPTVWSVEKWGEKHAINAGDLLHILARNLLETLKDNGFPSESVLEIISLFSSTSIKLATGQFYDMQFEERNNVSVDEYLTMIAGKTGALIDFSILMPAILLNTDSETVSVLKEFSRALGRIFQLQDDYLGIWGETIKTGKSTMSDIQARKKTYPVVFALEKSNDPESSLTKYYIQKVPVHANEIKQTLDELGVKKATEEIIAISYKHAIEKIEELKVSKQLKEDYKVLTEFFAKREH